MRYLWIILMFTCISIQAQKHDNNWLMGGNCVLHPDFSIATLDFQKLTNIPIADSTVQFLFRVTNTAMSDKAGRLQFYTNGNEIYNYLHEPLKNGERLEFEEDCEGARITQGAFCVPHGEHSDQYNLFTIGGELLFEGVDLIGQDQRIYHNVVDMAANNGAGELIARRDLMLQDTLNSGQGMVCQHANGRDWWLLLFETDSNRYYRFLIDTGGVSRHG